MAIYVDLKGASRETLLVIIAEQQAVNDELRRRVEYLEAQLASRGQRRRPERRTPRRRRSHGFARQRMKPTRQVVHAQESCPEYGTGLSGGWVQRRREVSDLPMAPAEVTEHLIVARTCRPRTMPLNEA